MPSDAVDHWGTFRNLQIKASAGAGSTEAEQLGSAALRTLFTFCCAIPWSFGAPALQESHSFSPWSLLQRENTLYPEGFRGKA